MKNFWITSLLVVLLSGCSIAPTTPPDGIEPVKNFDVNTFVGEWYEIARLPNSFEHNLNQVTATYTLNKDGTVTVLNQGYDTEKATWRDAEGTAKFVGANDVGLLKVSFFGPFYGAYVVFYYDKEVALVTGPNRSYFWMLAREPKISDEKKQELVQFAAKKGFDVRQLIFPQHHRGD